MNSNRAFADRTCLLLFIFLAAGVGWGQTASGPASEPASQPASVLKPGDHILFIGDSITGLGDREITTQSRDTEFVPLIRQALAATHKDSKFELVTLGASGSTVGAWHEFFRRAADPKQKEFTTDVPQFGVKATLARNWDVVIIMLGMNDVLQPAVNDDKESLANWDASYARLVQTVRDRLHPRVVALAQCTMASEDPSSAMNKFIDKLNEHVAATAKKADCVFLPTNTWYRRILGVGREIKSDFHVMYDFIHPNAYGQLAIAMGMAEGLCPSEDQEYLRKLYEEQLLHKVEETPHIFCSVRTTAAPGTKATDDDVQWFQVMTGRLPSNDTPVKLTPPQNWTLTNWGKAGWGVSGKPDKLRNILLAEWKGSEEPLRLETVIHAPWLITAGPTYIWREKEFNEKDARTAIDETIEAGKDFTSGDIDVAMQASSVPTSPAAKTTGKLTWHRFFPSADYTGGDAPGNVDFWSISYPRVFETGYAARWVWSDKDRPVRLVASSKGFTRGTYMQVWLNGKKEYTGEVSEEKDMKKEFPGSLKKGWNCVAFRCCHRSYFFQSDLEMLGVDKDNLDDLRYSVVPKDEKSAGPPK